MAAIKVGRALKNQARTTSLAKFLDKKIREHSREVTKRNNLFDARQCSRLGACTFNLDADFFKCRCNLQQGGNSEAAAVHTANNQ